MPFYLISGCLLGRFQANRVQPPFGFSVNIRRQGAAPDGFQVFLQVLRIQRAHDNRIGVWMSQGEAQQETGAFLARFA